MRRAILLTALVALALPVQTAHGGRGGDDDDRPFRRGTILPSIGFGGSFSKNYGGSLLVGAGASYFVVGGLAVGLHLRNVSTFYSQYYKDYLGPELFAQIPTNEFSVTPGLLWVLYRGQRVAPYLSAGVGPVFLNKHRGVLGQWSVGPGVYIGTGGSLWIDLGFGINMRFTNDRCQRAYTAIDPATKTPFYNDYACGLIFGFRGGLVFGIGGRRQPRTAPPRPSPPPDYNSQPASSYPEPYTAPAPAQPVPSASPPPGPTPPLATPPEGPPPPATAPPAETPPATVPPETTAPPAGESVPVPPPA